MLSLPALETAIVLVRHISRIEVGDKVRTTIDADRVSHPPQRLQVSTFSDWRAALAMRALELARPLTISFRNYGHGDHRLVLMEWAS